MALDTQRYYQLASLASDLGFPRFQDTRVRRYLDDHGAEAEALLGASDEAFTTAVEALLERYPNVARPQMVVEILTRFTESAARQEGVKVHEIGEHPRCECEGGTVWFQAPAAIYGGELTTMAAYCPHCMSEQQRKRRAELYRSGLATPPRVDETQWDRPEGDIRPIAERIRLALGSQDPELRAGAKALAAMLEAAPWV